MSSTPIQVILKHSTTAIGGTAFDKRSNAVAAVLIGVKGEVVVIPRDNIAAIIMEPEVAENDFSDN